MAVVNRFLALVFNKWVFLIVLLGAVGYGVYMFSQNNEGDIDLQSDEGFGTSVRLTFKGA